MNCLPRIERVPVSVSAKTTSDYLIKHSLNSHDLNHIKHTPVRTRCETRILTGDPLKRGYRLRPEDYQPVRSRGASVTLEKRRQLGSSHIVVRFLAQSSNHRLLNRLPLAFVRSPICVGHIE